MRRLSVLSTNVGCLHWGYAVLTSIRSMLGQSVAKSPPLSPKKAVKSSDWSFFGLFESVE